MDPTAEKVLIIELGQRLIRLLEGHPSDNGVELTAEAEIAVPEDMDFADVQQCRQLEERLRVTLDERFTSREATVVFSEALTQIRSLTLPTGTESDLESIVQLRAESEFPIALEDSAWGYRSMRDGTGELTVALALARASDVQARLALLRKAGIQPRHVRSGVLALCEAYRSSDAFAGGADDCLLELRTHSATVVFVHDGHPQWCRELTVPRVGAEAAGRDLAREVRESLRYYATELSGASPLRIILFGVADHCRCVARTLRAALAVEVVSLPDISRVQPATSMNGKIAADWPVAVGALLEQTGTAERSIDLLPSLEQRPELVAQQQRTRRNRIMLGLAAVLVVLAITNWLWMKQVRLALVNGALESVMSNQPQTTDFQAELAVLNRVAQRSIPWLEVLAELSAVAPEGITLNSAVLQRKGNVELAGTAKDYRSVEEFAANLNASRWFTGAVSANMTKPKQSIEFRITCQLRERHP